MNDRMMSLEELAGNITRDTGIPMHAAREAVYVEMTRLLRVSLGSVVRLKEVQ